MIYCIMGFGKGKTESAIGCTIRALQNGDDVLFVQFLKGGNSSEIQFFQDYARVHILTGQVSKITLPENLTTIDMCDSQHLFSTMANYIAKNKPKLVIADELLPSLDMGLITIEQVEYLILKCKEVESDLYMTGRIKSKALRNRIAELSDICTDAFCVKHSYNSHCKKCSKDWKAHYVYCPYCGNTLIKSRKAKLGRDY